MIGVNCNLGFDPVSSSPTISRPFEAQSPSSVYTLHSASRPQSAYIQYTYPTADVEIDPFRASYRMIRRPLGPSVVPQLDGLAAQTTRRAISLYIYRCAAGSTEP